MKSSSPASKWLVDGLADEHWFGDARPKWKHLPTSAKAKIERIKRSRLLRKHGGSALGTVIANCAPRARCLSGCCPECGRALQRFFAAGCKKLLLPSHEYDAVSIVGRTHRQLGSLDTLSTEKFQSHLSRALRKGHAGIAVGGIDFSFNEYPGTKQLSRWVPQFWLLIHNANRTRWENVLRKQYPTRVLVPRPIKIQSWDGNIAAAGYALKTNFIRRRTIQTERYARGKYRPCQNTTNDRLRAIERVELYRYLHAIGLEARIVLFDISKIKGGFDVAL
jgi:hypothetical protein